MNTTEQSEQRRFGRYRPDRLSCNLGQVLDLSSGGLRVLSPRPRQGSQTVVFQTPRMGKITLDARVAWRRQMGPKQHLLGLAFENVSPSIRPVLQSLVKEVARGESQGRSGSGSHRRRWIGLAVSLLGVGLVALSRGLESPAAWPAEAFGLYHETFLRLAPTLRWGALIAGGLLVLTGLSEMSLRHGEPVRSSKPPKNASADRRGKASAGSHTTAPGSQVVAQMRESQRLLNGILESSLGGVAVLKSVRENGVMSAVVDFEVQLINRAAEDLIGRSERQLVGKRLRQSLPCLSNHAIFGDLTAAVGTGLPVQKHYRLDTGRWVQVAVVQLGDGLAVTFADTTDQHQAQARLRHVAYHDELTGLPNRKLLMEHLENALARTRGHQGHRFAVLFLDFDRFKIVNDTLGHEVGDMLLNSISQRLSENIRSADLATVAGQFQLPARLGGDEFVVMLDGIRDQTDATAVARRLLDTFNQPHQLGCHQVVSTASIGIVVSHRGYDCVDELIRDADTAMYEAKNSGKARYVVFDQQMHETLVAQAQLERDLREAVAQEAFTLVYEPIIDLDGGRVAGFEALIRWEHATRGDVPPTEFIPLAEELNLIGPVGEWVLKESCAQLARWQTMGVGDLFLNINLSRAQLYDGDLKAVLRELIDLHHLDPASISLEITETMVVNDVCEMGRKLRELKELGIRLALDDFGTGHSSLNVLQELPLDTLKIDRTFIANAGDAVRRYGAIIATITELARNLDMQVIAEGIERAEQVDLLRGLACDYAQGWLFSRAVDADGATAMLQAQPTFLDAA
jgi:diguanylate cyclase (GGDEF)-like protein